MSKHSKNNTSSSVFTYAERQKLKNVYGTIQTRIGQDSVKKFQDCTVCHSRLIQPTSCDHGHMFCRSCAIQYIVKQKRKHQRQGAEMDKLREHQFLKNKQSLLKKQVEKLDKFEKFDNFLTVTERNGIFKSEKDLKKQDEQQRIDLKNYIKPTGIYQLNKEKEKYVKSSFWTIQNTPQNIDKVADKEKVQRIVECPGFGPKHKLALKKLRDIKINELDNVFCCWVCRKQIGRQKIGSYKCGHLVCLNCKSQQCQICQNKQKWMQIQGNSSAFSSHHKSQVKTYTHAFIS